MGFAKSKVSMCVYILLVMVIVNMFLYMKSNCNQLSAHIHCSDLIVWCDYSILFLSHIRTSVFFFWTTYSQSWVCTWTLCIAVCHIAARVCAALTGAARDVTLILVTWSPRSTQGVNLTMTWGQNSDVCAMKGGVESSVRRVSWMWSEVKPVLKPLSKNLSKIYPKFLIFIQIPKGIFVFNLK